MEIRGDTDEHGEKTASHYFSHIAAPCHPCKEVNGKEVSYYFLIFLNFYYKSSRPQYSNLQPQPVLYHKMWIRIILVISSIVFENITIRPSGPCVFINATISHLIWLLIWHHCCMLITFLYVVIAELGEQWSKRSIYIMVLMCPSKEFLNSFTLINL